MICGAFIDLPHRVGVNKIFIIVVLAISEHGSYPQHCTQRFFSAKMGMEGHDAPWWYYWVHILKI